MKICKKMLFFLVLGIFLTSVTAGSLKYGDNIRLQNVLGTNADDSTNYYLKGLPGIIYSHPGTSGQEMVVGVNPATGDKGSVWVVKGARGTTVTDGTTVKVGETIRLELYGSTPVNRLHSQNTPSPITGQGEVTIYAGTDVNDNWIIEAKNKTSGSDVNYADQIYLTHSSTQKTLHSHLGFGGAGGTKLEYNKTLWPKAVFPDGAIGYQEVTAFPGKYNNSLWTIEASSSSSSIVTSWEQITGTLINISVGPNGQVWGVNKADNIYFRTGITATAPKGTGWEQISGTLVNISVGPNGQVWGVNRADNIFFRTGITATTPKGTGWEQISGTLVNISVGPNGQVWGVNRADNIFFRTGITATTPKGTGWEQISGTLVNISAGPDGQVWGVNRADNIFFRTGITATTPKGTGWEQISGTLVNISVGPDGQVWGVNRADNIFFRTGITATTPKGTGWKQVPGTLVNISVGSNGQVWGVNRADNIYFRANPIVMPPTTAPENTQKISEVTVNTTSLGGTPLSTPAVTPFNPPADMTEDPAQSIPLKKISVGSRNSELEVWAIGSDDKPYRYNAYAGFPYTLPTATATSPWEKQELKDDKGVNIPGIIDISISSFGFMAAIRMDTQAAIVYNWESRKWLPLIKNAPVLSGAPTFKLKQISINNENEIFVIADTFQAVNPPITTTDQIYLFDKTTSKWIKLSPGKYVASGMDTNKKLIVIGIAQDGTPYECTMTQDKDGKFEKDAKTGIFTSKWVIMPGVKNLDLVTIGNRDNIYGIDKDNKLWKWDDKTKTWTSVIGKDGTQAIGFELISANAAGTLFAVDGDGDSLLNKTDGVKITATSVTAEKAKKETKLDAKKKGIIKSTKKAKKTVKKTKKKIVKKITKKPLLKTPLKQPIKKTAAKA